MRGQQNMKPPFTLLTFEKEVFFR